MNIHVEQIMEAADEACELLKAMANPHRLAILCQLAEEEKSVGDLAAFLGMRQSAVSQNLALMRDAGLVSARREGQTMWYTVSNPSVRKLLETLYCIYCPASVAGKTKQKRVGTKRKGA